MIRSLLLKLGMLALTIAVVVWVGRLKHSEAPRILQETPVKETSAEAPSPTAVSSAARTPTVTEAGLKAGGAARVGAPSARRPEAKLDLNRATMAEFERLPGIGPVLAKTLWENRERHGPFRTVEDLKRVKGIGAKRLELVRPLVTVHASETTKRKPQ